MPGAIEDDSSSLARVPDFFIAGQAKSGTTALWEMLRRHPQIFMPDVKEPHYFSSDIAESYYSWPDYLGLFDGAGPEQRRGEASVWYLRSAVAARSIAEVCPNARIIVVLREPASFLRSVHLQLIQGHLEREPDLRKALALEDQRRQDRTYQQGYMQLVLYSDHMRYVEQLRRFHDVMPRDNVLVLIYDDFRRDNPGTIETVLRFLGVDHAFSLDGHEANPTVRTRSVRLHRAVRSMRMGHGRVARVAKAAIMPVSTPQARERLYTFVRERIVFTPAEESDEALTGEIKQRFAPEVAALSSYLDRDLVTEWGYSGLA